MTVSSKDRVDTNFFAAAVSGEELGVSAKELRQIFRAMLQGGITAEEQTQVDALVKQYDRAGASADDVESLYGRAVQLQKMVRDHLQDVGRVGVLLPSVTPPSVDAYRAAVAKWCDAHSVLPTEGRDFDTCRAAYSRMISAFADSISSRCSTPAEKAACFVALHEAIARQTAQHIGGDTSVEGLRLDEKPAWVRAFTGSNGGKFAGDCTDFAELGLEIGRYFSEDFARVSFVENTSGGQLASQQHSVAAIWIDGTAIGISNQEARRFDGLSDDTKDVHRRLQAFAQEQTKIPWHGGQVVWKQ